MEDKKKNIELELELVKYGKTRFLDVENARYTGDKYRQNGANKNAIQEFIVTRGVTLMKL